ncbi:MAG: DUF4474 domain-containing protein [Clostridia bacterium]|nr:DUF4474 domain-containing protein [Clostridia bacterium]
MKKTQRIIALILSLAIGFSALTVSASAADGNPQNFEEYREMLEDGGYPAMTTKQFMGIVKAFNTVIRFFTGRGLIEQEHFNFTTDAMLTEICNNMAEETGLDLLMMLSQMPESNQYAEFVTETFQIDTTLLRDKFYEKRFEFDDQGQTIPAMIMYFLGLYFSVIEECEAFCIPLEEMGEGYYEIALRITVRDGMQEVVTTGVVIDTVNNLVKGKDSSGMLGIGFEFSYTELLLYSQVNVWMRDFGFTFLYDLFSYTTPFFFYNTRRIKFDYDGLEWMIQVWKGNYLVSNGAEVGIYTREPGSFGTYYNCANNEQMMNMSMELYHGDDLLMSRPKQLHWWLTGFKITDTLYPAKSQTLKFSIEMKDEEMLNAFCNAVENHYRGDMEYTVDGLTVNVVW